MKYYLILEMLPDIEVINSITYEFSRNCGFESSSTEFSIVSVESPDAASIYAKSYEIKGYYTKLVCM